MVHKETSEKFNHEVNADKNHAQILIQISPFSKTFEEAKAIIEDSGIHIIETGHLSSNWVLIKLDIMDMRDIVLKLTQNGFSDIKGINALRFKSNRRFSERNST